MTLALCNPFKALHAPWQDNLPHAQHLPALCTATDFELFLVSFAESSS